MAENKSNRVFLIVSVSLGIVATVIAFVIISNRDNQDRTPLVDVYYTRGDLQANQIVSESNLELKAVPRTPSTESFVGACFTRLTPVLPNQRVVRRIPAGVPLFRSDLGASVDIDLSDKYRAMSIPCRGANALSGLLQPGRDYVKILVTRPISNAVAIAPPTATSPVEVAIADPNPKIGITGERASVYRTFQLFSGSAVRVLAVGSRLSGDRAQPTAADQYRAAAQAENQQTVTLEVTENQAKEILEQTAGGLYQVTLILCPPTATQPVVQGTTAP